MFYRVGGNKSSEFSSYFCFPTTHITVRSVSFKSLRGDRSPILRMFRICCYAGTPTTRGATSRRIRPAGRRSSGTSSAFPGPFPTGPTPRGGFTLPTERSWPCTKEPPELPERSMPGAWCWAVPPTARWPWRTPAGRRTRP